MGYYSELELPRTTFTSKVHPDQITSKLSEINQYLDNYKFVLINEISENKYSVELQVESNNAKHYADEALAILIAKIMHPDSESIEMKFYGEDGETWGYRLEPGRVTKLITVWQDGDTQEV